MLDLDGFKAVNDTFGHKVGDGLLKGLANVLQGELRDYDFLARYAGDEFVAIVPDMDNQAVFELCQRMEKAVREFKLDAGNGRIARVGVSLGSAGYPNHGDTLDQILIAADKAMYAVKARRKARIKKHKADKLAAMKKKEEPKQPEKPIEIKEIEVEGESLPPVNVTPVEVTPAEDIEQIATVEKTDESIIVELDESHVIPTKPVN